MTRVLLAGLLLTVSLAGCGGSDDAASRSSSIERSEASPQRERATTEAGSRARYVPPEPGDYGLSRLQSSPESREAYLKGFHTCVRAVLSGRLPSLPEVQAPSRREAALRLLAQARPLVRAGLPPGASGRTEMKGCSEALRLGRVRAVQTRLDDLPLRIVREADPRIEIYGTKTLRLQPSEVGEIARASSDPQLSVITRIVALPSEYRKGEVLERTQFRRHGRAGTRGPVWLVFGGGRSFDECHDDGPAPAPPCEKYRYGDAYLFIEDRSGRIVGAAG